MVALKIFDVLILAAYVHTVHFVIDRNSKAALHEKNAMEPFGHPTLCRLGWPEVKLSRPNKEKSKISY